MGDNATRARYQNAVVWKASGYNSLGEATVDPPVDMRVRIEQGLRETVDEKGNVIGHVNELNVPESVPVGSLVWFGKKKDLPSPVPQVMQVIDYEEVPDVDRRVFDRWVKLMRHGDKDPILTTDVQSSQMTGVQLGVIASTTQTQGQQLLTGSLVEVVTVANENDVVTLPSAVAERTVTIINRGANTLQVFPSASDSINQQSVNTSVTMAPGTTTAFYAVNNTKWYTSDP